MAFKDNYQYKHPENIFYVSKSFDQKESRFQYYSNLQEAINDGGDNTIVFSYDANEEYVPKANVRVIFLPDFQYILDAENFISGDTLITRGAAGARYFDNIPLRQEMGLIMTQAGTGVPSISGISYSNALFSVSDLSLKFTFSRADAGTYGVAPNLTLIPSTDSTIGLYLPNQVIGDLGGNLRGFLTNDPFTTPASGGAEMNFFTTDLAGTRSDDILVGGIVEAYLVSTR